MSDADTLIRRRLEGKRHIFSVTSSQYRSITVFELGRSISEIKIPRDRERVFLH